MSNQAAEFKVSTAAGTYHAFSFLLASQCIVVTTISFKRILVVLISILRGCFWSSACLTVGFMVCLLSPHACSPCLVFLRHVLVKCMSYCRLHGMFIKPTSLLSMLGLSPTCFGQVHVLL